MAKKEKEVKQNKIGVVIAVLAVLLFFTFIFASIVGLFMPGEAPLGSGNVAVIPIKGLIVSDGGSSVLGERITQSSKVVDDLEQIKDTPGIKAVVLDINSPGGSAVASEEIADAVKDLDIPTVSFIRDVGASGAYWIASSTDKIYASRMSLTGSVGVISSYLEFNGILSDYNITYRRLVAGKYKDMGSPLKEMSDEELAIFQDSLDIIHNLFLDEISNSRQFSEAALEDISTARIYTGQEAKDLNLIDAFGGEREVKLYLEDLLGEDVEFVEFAERPGLFDLFAQSLSSAFYQLGAGFGSSENIGVRT